jgi:hypothetical protein
MMPAPPMGERPGGSLLGVGCLTPRQNDAFSLSRRKSRATYPPAPAVFPARESPRASHRAAFGMPGRAGKARSAAVVGSRPPVPQGGRGRCPPTSLADWRRSLLRLSRRRGCSGLVSAPRLTSLMARAAPVLAALHPRGPGGRCLGGRGPCGRDLGLGLGFLRSNQRRRQ